MGCLFCCEDDSYYPSPYDDTYEKFYTNSYENNLPQCYSYNTVTYTPISYENSNPWLNSTPINPIPYTYTSPPYMPLYQTTNEPQSLIGQTTYSSYQTPYSVTQFDPNNLSQLTDSERRDSLNPNNVSYLSSTQHQNSSESYVYSNS